VKAEAAFILQLCGIGGVATGVVLSLDDVATAAAWRTSSVRSCAAKASFLCPCVFCFRAEVDYTLA